MEVGTMLKSLTTVNVWVQDQDEALAFYTEKLGLELRNDVTLPEMGNFRWLTVGVPGQEDVAIVLMAARAAPSSPPTKSTGPTASSRAAESSSPRSRPTSPTAATPASATHPGTRCGSPSSATSGVPRHSERGDRAEPR